MRGRRRGSHPEGIRLSDDVGHARRSRRRRKKAFCRCCEEKNVWLGLRRFLIEDAEMTFHPKNSGCSPDSEHDTGSHHTPHCCYHPFPSSPSPSTTTPSRRRYGSLPSYSPVARKNDRPPYTDLKAVALYAALAPCLSAYTPLSTRSTATTRTSESLLQPVVAVSVCCYKEGT